MRLLIDPHGAEAFNLRTASTEFTDARRYYCARAPYLAILVCRNGLDLLDLRGQVVDARVGYEEAWREFARPGCEGQRHTKITIYRRLPQEQGDLSLSAVLTNGERDGTDAQE